MSVIGHFRLIMMTGAARPSPQVGQVLGPLGINMMNFFKEFQARTTAVRPDVPLQVTIVPTSDKQYKFVIRSPQAQWFLKRAARVPTASSNGALTQTGNITLKEIYHIAQAKQLDPQFIGASLKSICVSLIGTARSLGLKVTRDLDPQYVDRDDVLVTDLTRLRKEIRATNKVAKKAKK